MNSTSYTVNEMEEYVEVNRSPWRRYLAYFLLFGPISFGTTISIGSFSDPIKQSFKNFPVKDGVLPPLAWDLTTTFYCAGGLVGSLFSAPIMKCFGAKKNAIHGLLCGLCGSTCLVVSYILGSYVSYALSRFLFGFASGAVISGSVVFMYQIIHKSRHNLLPLLVQTSVNLGILLTGIASLKTISHNHWYAQAIPVTVSIAITLAVIYILPESPFRTYQNYRDVTEVIKVLRKIRSGNLEDIECEAREIEKSVLDTDGMNESSVIQLIGSRGFFWVLFFIVIVAVFQQLSGINFAIFYAGQMMEPILPNQEDVASVILFGFCVLGSLICSFITNYLGSKRSLCIGFYLMAISFFAAYILMLVNDNSNLIIQYSIVVALSLFAATFQLGPGPIPGGLFAQYFDPPHHSAAQIIAITFNWLANLLVATTSPLIQRLIGFNVIVMFAVINLVFATFLTVFMVDPTGRTPKEIVRSYNTRMLN